jgi:dTDP-3-amino-2,3,6-trideoxy-4-keto-D-glucose/dTDP-3-amino-3,4,6-trideoxy-alpha-D-glucose/dTDP-2,6-dideoxy-D-kanosamine transaminase
MPDSGTLPVVPFNDLGRATRAGRAAIDAAIARVLDSGRYVLGPEHDAFEAELADALGSGDAVLVGNGTDALELGLRALGVGPGDRVVTVANAGGYTSSAVRAIGAVPVYADVDAASLQMSVATLDRALAELDRAPAAVVITHLFGAVGDIAKVVARAREAGAAVLEDCAQSIGAQVGGRVAGTFGDLAAMSFYPTKNLGALGDGGALLTSDAALAAAVRRLRQYGWDSKYHAVSAGGRNSRLDELQAAILRVKLPALPEATERRREIHRAYEAADSSGALVNRSGEHYVAHLAVLRSDDREDVRRRFLEAGVQTEVHYPIPDHRQAVAGASDVVLPVTELAAESVLSIPLFPELADDEVERIADVLRSL